jgi:peptidoglycan/LPS O-acetylase OafA/YrhL
MAAVTVWLSHVLHLSEARNHLGVGALLLSWAGTAVIIFFLLSGIVIRLSYDRSPRSRVEFIRDRAIRILPLYYVAVLIGVAVEAILIGLPSGWTVVGHIFFAQSGDRHICPWLWGNGPLWSLTYEVFFYLVFAGTIGRSQRRFVACWAVGAIAAIGLQVLVPPTGSGRFVVSLVGYSGIWLLGYYAVDLIRAIRVDSWTAAAWAALIPMAARVELPGLIDPAGSDILTACVATPLFIHILQTDLQRPCPVNQLGIGSFAVAYLSLCGLTIFSSSSLPSSKVVYATVPLAACLPFLLGSKLSVWPPRLTSVSLFLGRISYALYVIHFPIMRLADTLPAGFWVRAACYLCASFVAAILLEDYFQRSVVRWLRGRAPMRAPSDTHAGSYFGLESRTAGLAARSLES